MSARSMPVPMLLRRGRGFGGLGQSIISSIEGAITGTGPTGTTAGTFADPNCPFSCWVFGNILDTEVLGQECWPCGNVCPSGQSWDTTNLVCSANPATTNPEAIASTPGGSGNCPTGQTWNSVLGECQGSTNIWMYVAIGGMLLLGGMVLAKK